jgi:hypothetical protein
MILKNDFSTFSIGRLPTDVQAEAIPLILGGGDVLMAAETGSGKTGAFCLPIIQIVWETLKDIQAGKGSKRSVASQVRQSRQGIIIFVYRAVLQRGFVLFSTRMAPRLQTRSAS